MSGATRYATRLASSCIAVLWLAACASPAPTARPPAGDVGAGGAPAAALKPMKVGYSAPSGTWSPLYVAAESGAFARHGLAVEIVPLFGSSGPQAMVAGDVPLMALGGTSAAPAIIEGADLVMVLASSQRLPIQVVATSAIDTPQALRGKRLAITRPGTLTFFGSRLALREWGLKPDEDVTIVNLNDYAGILAGLLGGATDAGLLADPFTFQARKEGLRTIADLGDSPTEYLAAGATTTHGFLRDQRPTVLAFVKGWAEGTKRYFDDPEFAIDVLRKYTQIDDRAVLEQTYALYAGKHIIKVPLPSVQGMQNVLNDYAETNPRARDVDAARAVDPSLVAELQQQGFYRELGFE
jgi:NitT/TauT family transport system substrate-binding protein